MKLYDNLIACTSAKHFGCIMKLNAPTYLSLSLVSNKQDEQFPNGHGRNRNFNILASKLIGND